MDGDSRIAVNNDANAMRPPHRAKSRDTRALHLEIPLTNRAIEQVTKEALECRQGSSRAAALLKRWFLLPPGNCHVRRKAGHEARHALTGKFLSDFVPPRWIRLRFFGKVVSNVQKKAMEVSEKVESN